MHSVIVAKISRSRMSNFKHSKVGSDMQKNMPMKQHRGFVIPTGSLPPTIQESGGDELLFSSRPDSLPLAIDGAWSLASEADIDDRSEQVGWQGLNQLAQKASWTPEPVSPSSGSLEVVGNSGKFEGVRRLVKAVNSGLKAFQEPEASREGMGGTYFFSDEAGRKVGIMKPCDEEPMAPNNPKGFVGRQLGEPGLKPTVRVGEAAIREVAAFLLDHKGSGSDHRDSAAKQKGPDTSKRGFASVPNTVLVRMSHPVFHQARASGGRSGPPAMVAWPGSLTSIMSQSYGSDMSAATQISTSQGFMHSSPAADPTYKLGSLQEYVAHDCDTSEMGTSCFSIRDVHRIGILDLRLFNTDRHAGNILVRRHRRSSSGALTAMERLDERRMDLIPIDHGFCLPETLEPLYVEWLHWPQAMIPFGEEELAYIARLDAAYDIKLLRQELPALRDESLRTLEVATALLKACAKAGLCLAEIGAVVSRPLVALGEEPSELEKMCRAAREHVDAMILMESSDEDDGCLIMGEPSIEEPNSWENSIARDSLAVLSQRATGPLAAGSTGPSTPWAESSEEPPSPAAGHGEDQLEMFILEDLADPQVERATLPSSPTPRGFSERANTPFSAGARMPDPMSPLGCWGGQPIPLRQLSSDLESVDEMTKVLEGRLRSPASMAAGNLFLRPAQTARINPKLPQRAMPRVKGAAYPPKIECARPTGGNVFSSLNKQAWRMFMEDLQQQIDKALAEGRWRQPQLGKPAYGMSCPRF